MLTETIAPQGFVITEPARAITITAGQTLVERFVNFPEVILTIEKVDINGNPLMGATFEIRDVDGGLIHRDTTNNGGLLTINGLLPGTIIIEETIPPEGFIITEAARTITIRAGEILTERFVNHRRPLWVVQKIDGQTEIPLSGVIFELHTLAGQRIQNPIDQGFEFATNAAGQIQLPHLYPGTFVLTETRPLPGYMAADPIVFTVGADNTYLITVRNYLYPDFNIRKLSSATNQPMTGVVFQIAPLWANGAHGAPLRNPINGSVYWTTDANGLIRLPNLEHGTYIATEITTQPGYILADPVVFIVDGHTNSPIAGGRFEISHYWGSGIHADRLRNPNDGTFTFIAGQNGLVNLGALEPGTYIITQTQAPTGFNPAEPYIFVVSPDSPNTTITIRNYRPAELTIQKINSITRAPLNVGCQGVK